MLLFFFSRCVSHYEAGLKSEDGCRQHYFPPIFQQPRRLFSRPRTDLLNHGEIVKY